MRDLRDIKKMLFISLVVGIVAQIHIGIKDSDFIVSAGILLFVTLVYHYEVNPIPTGILSGIAVYLFRLLTYYMSNGYLGEALYSYIFEILFYISYSLIYYILMKKGEGKNLGSIFLVLIVSDFGANFIEITIRSLMNYDVNFYNSEVTLLAVSLVRSSIIWITMLVFDNYGMLLLKKEHEERYRKLLLFSSKLKTEMYWIEKNMDNIEDVMTKSYELYEKISSNEDRSSWSDIALNIARDIHEVKKENGLVIRGIKEISEDELIDEGIKFSDIMSILKETMEREAKRTGNDIEFFFSINSNFYTKKHYFLMSILRNLVMNSMDAFKNEDKYKKISLIHKLVDEDHLFIINDNGPGISERDLEKVFSPGFSTKINYDTGEINRGLGLSIVQNITEEQLDGRAEIYSQLNKGTEFRIYIPRKSLEDADEDIYS